jgi:hypothetical protein
MHELTQAQRVAAERREKAQREAAERDKALEELRALLRRTPKAIGTWGVMATREYKEAALACHKVANGHAPSLSAVQTAIRTLSRYHAADYQFKAA